MLSGALGIVSLAHVEDGRRVYMSFFKTDSVLMSNSLRAQKNRPSVLNSVLKKIKKVLVMGKEL